MLELRSPEQGAPAAAVGAALVRRRGLLSSNVAASHARLVASCSLRAEVGVAPARRGRCGGSPSPETWPKVSPETRACPP
jgi:hypothetical protein